MPRALWTHLVKDLRIEWRSFDAIISMLFFSGLVVVLFSIAFDPRGEFAQRIAGGVLCVATMFASVSALNQAWAREIRHNVMDAQRMVPTPGSELFLAKVLVNFLGAAAGHLGAGEQRHLFCGAGYDEPQPRIIAEPDPVSDLHPGAAGDGAGYDIDPYRGERPRVVDQTVAGLRHYLHHGELAAV